MSNSTHKSNRGFTIVELLIVIVVIAILAAISIVAYNGVQNRTNNTAAATAAENVAKKLEAYNAIKSQYPVMGTSIATQLGSEKDSSLSGSGITLGTSSTDPAGDARRNTVYVQLCNATSPAPASGASGTGFKVFRWNFDTGAWQTTAEQTANGQKGGDTGACANATP